MEWTKNSWKSFKIRQQPEWPNIGEYKKVIEDLRNLPSLVFSGETRNLIKDLSEVNKGKRFILQVGNCAESFDDCNGPKIHNFLRILLQLSIAIDYRTNKKSIKIGRVAGQYAKPRSSNIEIINGEKLPSYRGDIVNSYEPTLEARIPQPGRLKEGYFRSAATLNLIRAFIQGGYGCIQHLGNWEEHFFASEIANHTKYQNLVKEIKESFKSFKSNYSINNLDDQVYTSHEGLLLDFEQAFTRLDTTFKGYYDTSAHFLWIGDRTRQLDSAHVEFFSGIGNPVGIKIGPNYDLDEILSVIKKLNQKNIDGKLVLITRFGKEQILEKLPSLIAAIKQDKLNVIWTCDPMHGNTFTHNGYKVRAFEDIVDELRSFFKICGQNHVIPGGLHLEITEENVTECTGGINGLTFDDISEKYLTKVDPRLNAAQALEVAFIASELINQS